MSREPPTEVLTDRLGEALAGREVVAAVFTTFRFEPAFFEQEILPVLFDMTWHHVPRFRAVQLDDVLRPLSGRLAVYYDHRALVEGDLGSAVLDVRRIPCRPGTGYFHPKTTFVLVEGAAGRALVTMTSSANLTRAGWWQNVESAAIEEIPEAGRSRMRDELVAFVRQLRSQTAAVDEHAALDEVRRFLSGVTQLSQRTSGGRLHPHFHASGRRGARSVADFIADTMRGKIDGWRLEVLSPYVDDADTSKPLEELAERFGVRDVTVLVPEDRGRALCRETLYDSVEQRGWRWGRLPEAVTSGGSDPNAAARTVHAKVYRFFEGDQEVVVVGSANLTTAGHQEAGNVEAEMLLERRHDRRVQPWLTPVEEAPAFFEPTEEDEGRAEDPPRLVLRYDWAGPELAALWQSDEGNPRLHVSARRVPLFVIDEGSLPPRDWHVFEGIDHDDLQSRLRASSFLTVVDDDGRGGVLLVLEVGFAYRPSLVLALTPAEILQYWALLTPEQRSEYVAQHGDALAGEDGDEALVAGADVEPAPETMFDRFAGMFHGFASLERKVLGALDEERDAEAEFLVFGQKPDSLRRLVDRVAERDDDGTLAYDYLLLLCAEQLVRRLRREWPRFWAGAAGAGGLEDALRLRGELRAALVDANGPEMARFLAWHERMFLRPARRHNGA